MRTSLYVTITVVFIFMFSCDKEDNSHNISNDFLPMEIGNYWQLEHSEKREISGKTTIDSKEYFTVVYNNEYSYYRTEGNKVWVRENNLEEAVKFDFNKNLNETWTYNAWTVKIISKTDSLKINNEVFKNCFHFYFDIPEMADDEYSVWLAPNIGFVQEQCGECLYQIRKLECAKVGSFNLN